MDTILLAAWSVVCVAIGAFGHAKLRPWFVRQFDRVMTFINSRPPQ